MIIDSKEQITVTDDNLEDVQDFFTASDMRSEIEIAVKEDGQAIVSVFAFTYSGGQRGDLLVIHSRGNRAGINFGGYSDWGDWDPDDRVLTLDTGEKYYEDGEEVEEEED